MKRKRRKTVDRVEVSKALEKAQRTHTERKKVDLR